MEFVLKMMNSVLKMMEFVLKMMNSVLKMMEFVLKIDLGTRLAAY